MTDAKQKLVILDTDPGIDDAMAILYMAAHAGTSLHSLTTVFGNGDVATTTRNARYIVDRFGLALAIHPGADAPLNGERFIPDLKVHGDDGLGDSGLATSVGEGAKSQPAWKHICQTVRANPGQVTLLAIGPLTNLALALRHDPDIAELVDQVVVMGGAFGTKGRRGNIRPHAEANFFYDALAAQEVLNAPWPITVVGLDVTADCILTSDQAQQLATSGGDAGAFLWQISRGYAAIYKEFDGIDGYCIHDVAAAAFVTSPDLFTCVTARFDVGNAPENLGASLALDPGASGLPSAKRYCSAVDARQLVDGFMQAMSRYGEKAHLPLQVAAR
jgi:inosine-uridine nucleoside N-ribohydrolase